MTTTTTTPVEVSSFLDNHPSCNWHLLVEGTRKDILPGTRPLEQIIQRAEARYPGKQVRIEKW